MLQQPGVRARIRELGQEPAGTTPDEYNALIRSEMKRWEPGGQGDRGQDRMNIGMYSGA